MVVIANNSAQITQRVWVLPVVKAGKSEAFGSEPFGSEPFGSDSFTGSSRQSIFDRRLLATSLIKNALRTRGSEQHLVAQDSMRRRAESEANSDPRQLPSFGRSRRGVIRPIRTTRISLNIG